MVWSNQGNKAVYREVMSAKEIKIVLRKTYRKTKTGWSIREIIDLHLCRLHHKAALNTRLWFDSSSMWPVSKNSTLHHYHRKKSTEDLARLFKNYI